MKKLDLVNMQKENEFTTFEIAVVNTFIIAPRFLSEFTKKYRNSRLTRDWPTFIAWLASIMDKDQKYELVNEKYLIFKGALEFDRLTTKPEDIISKLEIHEESK